VVKTYKYLGLDFEDTLKWNLTRQRLVTKAKGRLALIRKAMSEGLSLKAAENVWWSMVVPVLNFGAEIWGASNFTEADRVQMEAGRSLLGVSRKTANAVVRGELGWWSMRAQREFKILMYWARLIRMDNTRLAKQVYRQRREQRVKRKGDWCSQVRKILVDLELGHIWNTELVGKENDWKGLLKASFQAREDKEWKKQVDEKPKLRLYKRLKYALEREEYIDVVSDKDERRLITAMRGGTNTLRIETGRWENELLEERTCVVCAIGQIEDELHFLLGCSAYERERRRLFKSISEGTSYDCRKMADDKEWLAQFLLGVGCPGRQKRIFVQQQVAKFLEVAFKHRLRLMTHN
jgi:hypothetical protein